MMPARILAAVIAAASSVDMDEAAVQLQATRILSADVNPHEPSRIADDSNGDDENQSDLPVYHLNETEMKMVPSYKKVTPEELEALKWVSKRQALAQGNESWHLEYSNQWCSPRYDIGKATSYQFNIDGCALFACHFYSSTCTGGMFYSNAGTGHGSCKCCQGSNYRRYSSTRGSSLYECSP